MPKSPHSGTHSPREKRRPSGPPRPRQVQAVREGLLAWFASHRRDLPWRRTRDPYAVLVSEVMLQQIQVVRAIPFYGTFLQRFPTIQALAGAPMAEAIRVWGALGRYKRVVNLHRAAQLIVREHDGRIPGDIETLRRLPGIGPYTAGAVACFAYEHDVAFVDTNVRRVLHRVFIGVDVPRPTAGDAEIMQLAEMAIPPGRGWVWNQALIEFGALHCTARRPACHTCPIQLHCLAYPALDAALAEQRQRVGASPRAQRYEESNRYYRGRVLAHLRNQSLAPEAEAGIDLKALGAEARVGFAETDVAWLFGVVESLAKDGLAVAEERPVYDAGGPTAEPKVEVRVRLP